MLVRRALLLPIPFYEFLKIATLLLFPGIGGEMVRKFLSEPLRGVVLETYGSGNASLRRSDLISALKEACDRGVVIVAISQCSKGAVTELYENGRRLMQTGVIPGRDMTREVGAIVMFGPQLLTSPSIVCACET
jgi:lysophospholipase